MEAAVALVHSSAEAAAEPGGGTGTPAPVAALAAFLLAESKSNPAYSINWRGRLQERAGTVSTTRADGAGGGGHVATATLGPHAATSGVRSTRRDAEREACMAVLRLADAAAAEAEAAQRQGEERGRVRLARLATARRLPLKGVLTELGGSVGTAPAGTGFTAAATLGPLAARSQPAPCKWEAEQAACEAVLRQAAPAVRRAVSPPPPSEPPQPQQPQVPFLNRNWKGRLLELGGSVSASAAPDCPPQAVRFVAKAELAAGDGEGAVELSAVSAPLPSKREAERAAALKVVALLLGLLAECSGGEQGGSGEAGKSPSQGGDAAAEAATGAAAGAAAATAAAVAPPPPAVGTKRRREEDEAPAAAGGGHDGAERGEAAADPPTAAAATGGGAEANVGGGGSSRGGGHTSNGGVVSSPTPAAAAAAALLGGSSTPCRGSSCWTDLSACDGAADGTAS